MMKKSSSQRALSRYRSKSLKKELAEHHSEDTIIYSKVN